MKRLFKSVSVILSILSLFLFSGIVYADKTTDSSYYVSHGESLCLKNGKILKCDTESNEIAVDRSTAESVGGYAIEVSLFGIFPVKTVTVSEIDESDVAVLGQPFGLKIYTDGVLTVGYSDIEADGKTQNPAKDAGIKIGDTVLSVDGKEMTSNEDLRSAVKSSNGHECELTIRRGGEVFSVKLTPIYSKNDKAYKIGLWVRDSSAGIGMLTFYDPKSGVLAGLGHGICDADTGELLEYKSGSFTEAEIVGIEKSTSKATGELKGIFSGGDIAQLAANDVTGVYGVGCEVNDEFGLLPIALKQEITEGKAEIVTTLEGGERKTYACKIERVYSADNGKIKNMVIKVTDKSLLEKTGGIVQGMSGSPIIQNGKLIGAVTHVFVNDSTRGYGIFAENMLATAKQAAENAENR